MDQVDKTNKMSNNINIFQQIDAKRINGESLIRNINELVLKFLHPENSNYNISFAKTLLIKNDLSKKFTLKVRNISITESKLSKEEMILENNVLYQSVLSRFIYLFINLFIN